MARSFLTGEEISASELTALVGRAGELKALRFAADAPTPLAGRSVALIFEQPSTRTRVSFEVGVFELGGHPVVLRGDEMQLTRGESVGDTARVLSRFVSAIVARTASRRGSRGAGRGRRGAGDQRAHAGATIPARRSPTC